MKTWIRGCVCAAVVAIMPLAPGAFCLASAQAPAPWQDEWLTRFNGERARSGVRSLLPSPVLNQVAQQQAEEMARNGRRLRSEPAEAVSERLRRVGYSAHDWREDFLQAQAPPESALFTRSSSPQAALDGHFRDLGIGVAAAGGVTHYVFLFGWHQGDYFAAATAQLANRAKIAADLLARVNAVRRNAGLPPFASNPLLDRISQEHAEDMLMRSYSGHRTPEGLGPSDRARADGYKVGIGENIVEQRFSVEEALEAWLGSPGHRRNILDPGCREMGLGLAVGGGYDAAPGGYRVVWVQSVGRGE
ncbi:MAG: CAP domain-containing protein [Thermoanaerobaculia bacterium]